MAIKNSAYVDTSAFISFLDRSDTWHSLFGRLFSDPPKLVTTPLVIAEGHAWFLRRYDSFRATQFLNFIGVLKPLQILAVARSEIESAAKTIRRYSDQPLTLADALGIDTMRKHKVKICWSTDRHLAIEGANLAIDGLD